MQRNMTSEQHLLWVPLGYKFRLHGLGLGLFSFLLGLCSLVLSFLGKPAPLLFQLEFESPIPLLLHILAPKVTRNALAGLKKRLF